MLSFLNLIILFASTSMAQTMEERFIGSILGVYLGDALGKGVEFVYKDNPWDAPRSYQERNVLVIEPREDPPESKRYFGQDKHQPRGTYTDDTEETLAVLKTLIEQSAEEFSLDHMTRNLSLFYKPAHGYSRTTGELLSFYKSQIQSQSDVLEKRNQFYKRQNSLSLIKDSNGCAMRIAGLALRYAHRSPEVLSGIVSRSCLPTHPGSAAKEGAVAMAYALTLMLKFQAKTFDGKKFLQDIALFLEKRKKTYASDASKDETLSQLLEYFPTEESEIFLKRDKAQVNHFFSNFKLIQEAYEKNLSLADETEFLRKKIGVGIEASRSIPSTLYLVAKYGRDLQQTLNATLQVSLAGDTDTLPSMAGSLLGALHGNDFPKIWFDQLYNASENWKSIVGYRDGHHEDLRLDSPSPTYISVSEVQLWAKKLYDKSLARD